MHFMHVKVIAPNGDRMDDVFVLDVVDGPSQPTPQSDCILRLTPQMQSVSQVWHLIRNLVPNHHDWLHLFNVNSYWEEDGYRYQVTLDQDQCSDLHHGFESKLRSLGLHFHKIRIIKSDWRQDYDYRRHRRRHAQIQPTPSVDSWSPYASTSIIQSASQLEEDLTRPVPSLASPSLMASASLFPSIASGSPFEMASSSSVKPWAQLYTTPVVLPSLAASALFPPDMDNEILPFSREMVTPTPALPSISISPTPSTTEQLSPSLTESTPVAPETITPSVSVATTEAEVTSSNEISSTTTPSTSSTVDGDDFTDTDEPSLGNTAPQVHRRIQKLALTAGSWFKFSIPEDVFEDRDEGSTSQLKLSFYLAPNNGTSRNSPPADYWIQFNSENQFLYALPTEKDVGTYTFILMAADSAGLFVEEGIEVLVRQNRAYRTFHHWISMHSVTWDSVKYPVMIQAAEKLLSRIAQQAFGDSSLTAIYVRSITERDEKYHISWTNSSLPVQPCPKEKIDNNFLLLADREHPNRDGRTFPPSLTLKQLLIANEFSVQSVQLELDNVCRSPLSGSPESSVVPRNGLGLLQIPIGQIYRKKIEPDLFYSPNTDLPGLDIDLLDISGKLVPLDGLIGYKKETLEIYALALAPIPKSIQELMLYVKEPGRSGAITSPFAVEYVPPVDTESPGIHESFLITMGLTPQSDDSHLILETRVNLIWKLATEVLGDTDPSNIFVKSFQRLSHTKRRVSRELPHSSPYYEIVWTNSSLKHRDSCPVEAIQSSIIDKMFTGSSFETDQISRHFEPDFTVVTVAFTPLGNCSRRLQSIRLGAEPVIVVTVSPTESTTTSTNSPVSVGPRDDDDDETRYYMSSILPALITLVVMLIVALCVVCFLVRYRRSQEKRGQYEVYAGRSETDAFLLKGRTPAILEQELHHHPQQQHSPYGYPYAPQVVMPPHHQNVQVTTTFSRK